MLDNFIYENHLGQRFFGLENGVYLNIGELRDYTWTHETINNRISRFYRKTTNRKIPLYVVGETYAKAAEAMNRLFEITEADIAANIPGSVFVGDYYTRGFITTSKKTRYLDNRQLCKIDLTLTSDDPSWYKNTTHSFYTNVITPKNKKSGNIVILNGAPNAPFRGLTVYGKTTQNGTPSPDSPYELLGAGGGGSVVVSVIGGLPEGGDENITIITQPRNVSSPINSDILFSVVAIGEGLTYQWEYMTSGSTIWKNSGMPGNNTDTLTFSAKAYHDGYKYRCLITDANGNEIRTNDVVITISDEEPVYEKPVTAKTATIITETGIYGIPVTSGGNYTDENGQQWIADTIEYDADAGTAKIVKRIKMIESYDGETVGKTYMSTTGSLTNGASVIYPLASPEETPISKSPFYTLKTINPATTVYNDVNAYMDVVYSTVENSSGASIGGMDYSFDHPYEYTVRMNGRSIVCDSFSGSAFRLMIYGECINPTVNIGGHAYTVNGTVGNGETLLIDSMAKTITLTTAYGNTINYFDKRSRDSYIFEPIPAGKNAVTWSGDFGFELTVIEKRSEPKWT